MSNEWRIPYDPSPRQLRAHSMKVDELLVGGAAGGGKSALLMADAITSCLAVPGLKAVIFRRTFAELEKELEPRLLQWVPDDVGRYNSSKHVLTFANGSQIILGYLENSKDIYRWQGVEIQKIYFDELTQFLWDSYTYLKSRLRASGKVLAGMRRIGMRPSVMSSTNPGGFSHHEVKEYFVDIGPHDSVYTDPKTGLTRAYIPFRYTDNVHIDQEEYGKQLSALPDRLRRALMFGDWDILEGTRFPNFNRDIHVIPAGSVDFLTTAGVRSCGVDYGLAAPFFAAWGVKLQDGTIIVYRECSEKGLAPAEQGALVRSLELPEEIGPRRPLPVVLDPSTWARGVDTPGVDIPKDDTPPSGSIAAKFEEALGRKVYKAQNDRVGGAALLDDYLRVREDGLPRIFFTSNCVNLIRTIPSLQSSRRNPEDIEQNPKQDDHGYDAVRYLLQELDGRTFIAPPSAGDVARRRASRPVDPLANVTR